jgi:hypothetical protein
VKLNGASLEKSFEAGTEELNVGRAKVAAGLGNLEAEIDINGTRAGAHYITVRKV